MWLLRGILTVVAITTFGLGAIVQASDAEPAPDKTLLPLYISGFSLSQQETISSLRVIELYNNTSDVIDMSGWRVEGSNPSFMAPCIIELSGYLLPKSFGLIAQKDTFGPDENPQIITITPGCTLDGVPITNLSLIAPEGKSDVTENIATGDYVRKNITSDYRGGTFVHDFTRIETANNRAPKSFYFGGWYFPTLNTPIRVTEILPHSRDCSPIENVMGCQDYVKLYNASDNDISLAGLRLRLGYAGQSITTSNAIVLGGKIPAKGYQTFMTKADGSSLSITDGGGWVWLEDMYGVGGPLQDSVVEYPSASGVSKIGWAWAFNPASGAWQWTSRLTDSNKPSTFYVPPIDEPGKGAGGSLVPYRSDQFRNPATNRCKLISSDSSVLTPCSVGQYRNPETNRCKAIVSTSSTSSLVPCKENQYRNPETNRCKSLASASSDLKPCSDGQERNPATNRCRTVLASAVPSADFPVEKATSATAGANLGWIVFAGLGVIAAGYAGWEWRYEIMAWFRKLGGLVKKS